MKQYFFVLIFLHNQLPAMCCSLVLSWQNSHTTVLDAQKKTDVLNYIKHKRSVGLAHLNYKINRYGLDDYRQSLYQEFDRNIKLILSPAYYHLVYAVLQDDPLLLLEKSLLRQINQSQQDKKEAEALAIKNVWKKFQVSQVPLISKRADIISQFSPIYMSDDSGFDS